MSLADKRKRLQNTFRFGETDLRANQQGTLGERQTARLKRRAIFLFALPSLIYAGIVMLIAAGYYFLLWPLPAQQQQFDELLRCVTPVAFAFFLLALASGVTYYQKIAQDFKQNRVRALVGPARIVKNSSFYGISINGDEPIHSTIFRPKAFENDVCYAIYVTPHSQTIVGADLIAPTDDNLPPFIYEYEASTRNPPVSAVKIAARFLAKQGYRSVGSDEFTRGTARTEFLRGLRLWETTVHLSVEPSPAGSVATVRHTIQPDYYPILRDDNLLLMQEADSLRATLGIHVTPASIATGLIVIPLIVVGTVLVLFAPLLGLFWLMDTIKGPEWLVRIVWVPLMIVGGRFALQIIRDLAKKWWGLGR
jgi:hypothetical protein